ncbi:MAG TPA: hypothetical protein VFS18_00945, partial [Actinomycetota bacterium]|nr:hypothetical protein [Actinomycetota bacterium]
LGERRITLELDASAREVLVAQGYEPAYGARPLKRLIQRSIENVLAMRLLDGTYRDGDTIRVSGANGELVFSRTGDQEGG